MKRFKEILENNIAFLHTSKSDMSSTLLERLGTHEKQIMHVNDLGKRIPVSYKGHVIPQSGSKAAQ